MCVSEKFWELFAELNTTFIKRGGIKFMDSYSKKKMDSCRNEMLAKDSSTELNNVRYFWAKQGT